MVNASSRGKFSRTLVTLLLSVLLAGSSLTALIPTASAAVQIDDVQPPTDTASTGNPYIPVTANISGEETGVATVDSASEWQAGQFGTSLVVGGTGTLEMRAINHDDFGGNGDPDPAFWTFTDDAVVGGGFLTLSTDYANSVYDPHIDHLLPVDLSVLPAQAPLVISTSMTVSYGDAYSYIIPVGWKSDSDASWIGVVLQDDGVGGGLMVDTVSYEASTGNVQIGYNFVSPRRVPYGTQTEFRLTQYELDATNFQGEWFDGAASEWVSLGAVEVDTSMIGTFHAWAGLDGGTWGAWWPGGGEISADLDFFDINENLTAPRGVYESARLDSGLYSGARITFIDFTTSDGGMGGIQKVEVRAGNGLFQWSSYQVLPLNTAIDAYGGGDPTAPPGLHAFVQFKITLVADPSPSWPDSISFFLAYKTEVGTYFYDDFPDGPTGVLNTDTWTASSSATFAEGLDLDSASTSTSIGVTYANDSWALSGSHNVEGVVAVRVINGSNIDVSGPADPNVLLAGFVATDGTTQTGYIGLVRANMGGIPYWALAWDNGSGPIVTPYFQAYRIYTDGQVYVRFFLVDGVFTAWVLETSNPQRGWITVEAPVQWGASGTASWRIGDTGIHSGTQHAIVDWAALLLKWMPAPTFGNTYSAGNIGIKEDENTMAVIAFSGPYLVKQRVTYRLDTTAPVGSFHINSDALYATSLTVSMALSASDRYGVSSFAADEALSFPSGWHNMAASSDFVLSPGDGRKVVWMRFLDTAGVASLPINQSIILDTVNPLGAIYIQNNSLFSTNLTVDLTLIGSDTNGVKEFRVSSDSGMASYSSFTVPQLAGEYQRTNQMVIPWTFGGSDGTKTAYVQVIDAASRTSSTYNDSILVDTTLPALTATLVGSTVHGGTTYVSSNHVTVAVNVSDAAGVQGVDISDDPTFAAFVSFPGSGNWVYDLPEVSGAHSLYVRALDTHGLPAAVQRLDFFVDVNAPTGTVEVSYTGQSLAGFLAGTPGCCDSATIAKGRGVVVTVSATDNVGVSDVMLSNSLYFPGATWQPYVAGKYFFELSSGDGASKTVYVRFRDVNGRVSQAFVDRIAMDTTAPTGSLIINSGDSSSINPLLTLSLEGRDNFPGELEMRLSLSPNFNGSTWVPFTDTAVFDAKTTSGEVTVYVQIRDANSWESLTYSDTIRMRAATCQELNNCPIIGNTPGFDGVYAAVAMAAVGAVLLASRRRKSL